MPLARASLLRPLILATLLGFAACGDGGNTNVDPEAERRPRRASKSKPTKPLPLADELARIEQQVEAAEEARDWAKGRRLVARGIETAAKDKDAFELHRARLIMRLGNIEQENGREIEARRHYADAMAIFRVEGSNVGRLWVHLALGRLEERLGDYAAAARQYDEAGTLLEGIDDPDLKGSYQLHTGRLAARQVKPEEASKAFLEAVRTFGVAKDKRGQAEALLLLAVEEDRLGKTKQCRRSLDRALKIFRTLGDKDGEVRALHKLAALAERDKQYRTALKLLKKVLELYEELDRQSDAAKVRRHIAALPEKGK
jgi:tetratricopeptide (TPR) repeat protein